MPKQQDIVNAMLERIKPNGVHQIDPIVADLLTEICARNKETIKERLPELEEILKQFGSNRTVDYDKYYLPYLTHYLPKNYAKVQNILLELMRKDLLPENMCIMDIGSGQGTSELAIANFFTQLAEAERELGMSREHKISVFSTEKYKNNREGLIVLRDRYCQKNEYARQNIQIADPWDATAHPEIEITESSKGTFDLVILSNVLTEMHDAFDQTVAKISQLVKSDGTIALIETADKVGTNKLNRAKEVLKEQRMTIYSPAGIWHPFCEFKDTTEYEKISWGIIGPCTMCAIEKPNMQRIRYDGMEGSRKDVKYSFVMMRRDGITTYEKKPGNDYVKLKDIKPLGKTNVRVFKQRRHGRWDKPEKQYLNDVPYSIWYTCDGTCGRKHMYLIAHPQKEREIDNAQDGDILDIKNALIQKRPDGPEVYVTADEGSQITVEKNTL